MKLERERVDGYYNTHQAKSSQNCIPLRGCDEEFDEKNLVERLWKFSMVGII